MKDDQKLNFSWGGLDIFEKGDILSISFKGKPIYVKVGNVHKIFSIVFYIDTSEDFDETNFWKGLWR